MFTLKAYAKKLAGKKTAASTGAKRKSFGDWAMVAMFVGMCAAYIGSYVGQAAQAQLLPMFTALVAAGVMAVCEWLERKRNAAWLENFDLAISMLVAMAATVAAAPVL